MHTHTQDPQPTDHEVGGKEMYDTLAKPTEEPPAQEQEGVSVTSDLQ